MMCKSKNDLMKMIDVVPETLCEAYHIVYFYTKKGRSLKIWSIILRNVEGAFLSPKFNTFNFFVQINRQQWFSSCISHQDVSFKNRSTCLVTWKVYFGPRRNQNIASNYFFYYSWSWWRQNIPKRKRTRMKEGQFPEKSSVVLNLRFGANQLLPGTSFLREMRSNQDSSHSSWLVSPRVCGFVVLEACLRKIWTVSIVSGGFDKGSFIDFFNLEMFQSQFT